MSREGKISPVLLGVAFRPMKGEWKQLWEIRQKVFGNIIDCRWQPTGGFFGPQWFFVMARPAIIQRDKAVFVCVCPGTSNITVLSSAAPQESRHTRGSRGSVTEGKLYQCETFVSVWLNPTQLRNKSEVKQYSKVSEKWKSTTVKQIKTCYDLRSSIWCRLLWISFHINKQTYCHK